MNNPTRFLNADLQEFAFKLMAVMAAIFSIESILEVFSGKIYNALVFLSCATMSAGILYLFHKKAHRCIINNIFNAGGIDALADRWCINHDDPQQFPWLSGRVHTAGTAQTAMRRQFTREALALPAAGPRRSD